MRTQILFGMSLLGLLTVAGCHKNVPVAARQTPPAPVAAPAPAPAPTQAAVRPAPRPAPAPASTPQRSATMTPQERTTLEQRLAHMEDALFDYDKYTIRTDASTALKEDVDVIRGILSNYPSQKLLIEGHADERGSDEYNLALGDKRAKAVEEFLVSMSVPGNQLTIISYGKDRPVCTDATESCWQKNRRAHITAAR